MGEASDGARWPTAEPEPDRDELLSLLDTVGDATLIVGRDWRVRFANRRAAFWLRDRGALVGRELWELVPESRDSAFHRAYERAITTGEHQQVEAYAPHHGAWLEADAHPTGEQLTIFFRECTVRRRAELVRTLLTEAAAAAEASQGTIRALVAATDALRALTGYEIGKVWLRDHAGTARLVGYDHPDRPELAAFAETVRQAGLVPDALAARALAGDAPLTVRDLPGQSDPTRAEAARAAGLRAGVFLPLHWPDGVSAVLCLLTSAGPGHDDWCAVLEQAHPPLVGLARRMRDRQELSQLFDLAREGLCITGKDRWFHRVNPELARMLGRSVEELLARPYLDLIHPDDRVALTDAADRLLAGEEVEGFEHRTLLPSGEERILSWTSRAVPEEGLIYSAARDVTAERRRERFETDQRALLRTIALGAPLGATLDKLVADAEAWLPGARASVWLVDRESDTLRVATAPSIPGAYLDEISPLPIGAGRSAGGEAVATGRTVIVPDIAADPRTVAFRDAAAANGLVACWAAPFVGTHGEVLGAFVLYPDHPVAPTGPELHTVEDAARLAGVAVVHDHAQSALAQSEERFRLLAGAATDAMWDWDLVGNTVWFNERFAQRFGYDLIEVGDARELWLDNIHAEDREAVLGSIEHAVDSGRREWAREYRFHRRDGSVAIVMHRGSILRDERGRAVRMVGGMWDLTAIRERQEEREQARRLESLGTFASGLAHDLNNMLAPILLSAEMLASRDLGEDAVRLTGRIEQSARRGREIIDEVLGFARGAQGERVSVDLGHLVDEAVEHALATSEEDIAVEVDVASDLAPVTGDSGQLHRVLVNLLTNGRDAMPEGGTLTVTARNAAADAAGRPRVAVWVADTGTGMSDEVLRRIREPFFTTKPWGRGTGLGLATATTIVESHGGTFEVASEVGAGTTVRLELPAEVDAPSPTHV